MKRMRQIDAKTQTTGQLQKIDGTPIPEDEPLILFRAKDKLLPELLRHYNELCRTAGAEAVQLSVVEAKIKAIEEWQSANPDKVKVPDYAPR